MKKEGAAYLEENHQVSERRACEVVGLARSSKRYERKRADDEDEVRTLIREKAEANPMFGYQTITALIRLSGRIINHKRVHRIWKDEGLQLPRRKARKKRFGEPQEVTCRAEYPNHVWSYDFLQVTTEKGNKVRILAVIDEFTRECLGLFPARSFPAREVKSTLEWLFLVRGKPVFIRSDNGPEFIAEAVKDWLRGLECDTLFITPGSPWENPFIESFIGKLRAQCLDRYVFHNLQEVQAILDHWFDMYNSYRPHSSLGYITPRQFALQVQSPAVVGH